MNLNHSLKYAPLHINNTTSKNNDTPIRNAIVNTKLIFSFWRFNSDLENVNDINVVIIAPILFTNICFFVKCFIVTPDYKYNVHTDVLKIRFGRDIRIQSNTQ